MDEGGNVDQLDAESGLERPTERMEGCEKLECGQVSRNEGFAGVSGMEGVEELGQDGSISGEIY